MKRLLAIKNYFSQLSPQQKRRTKLSAGALLACFVVAVSFQNCGQKFSTTANTADGQYSVSSVAGEGATNGGGSGREANGGNTAGNTVTPGSTPSGNGGGASGQGGQNTVGGNETNNGSSTCGASSFPSSGKISWTDTSTGATCHVTLATVSASFPTNNGAGYAYTAYGSTSDSNPGSGRICLKCVNNAIVQSTNPAVDCASTNTGTLAKQYCQPSTCSVRANYSWGSCAATNAGSTLNYGQSITLQNVSTDGSTGSVTLTCDRVGLNQNPTITSNTCQAAAAWQASSLKVDYPTSKISTSGVLMEGERKFYAYGESPARELSYNQMLAGAAYTASAPDYISPTGATLTECKVGVYPAECRTHTIDTNKLKFSIVGHGEYTSMYKPELANYVCFDTGQSVAEKRGLSDCGARGAVLVQLNDFDPTRYNPPVPGAQPRGTIINMGSLGYARGSFKIRAEITNATPGFEKYAGMAVEIPITYVNRPDIQITSNVTDIFATYQTVVFEPEMLGENGLGSATYKVRNCAFNIAGSEFPVLSTGYDQYSNRFRLTTAIKAAMSALPSGGEVKISCSVETYNGESASTFRIDKKP